MNYIDDLFYTKEHIWIKSYKDNQFYLGITNFAQDLLGDIIYIDLTLGKKFNSNDSIGTIESVKTASDIIAPANGEIILINQDTLKKPEKINESPHETWLCSISFDLEINKENYLSKQEYLKLIKD
ncbi:glycine cleavage system protein GcvH [Nitrosomonadales bacterium]|nr:glycine cleavage system protein GcvH [Nitrosomonadales bacterium]